VSGWRFWLHVLCVHTQHISEAQFLNLWKVNNHLPQGQKHWEHIKHWAWVHSKRSKILLFIYATLEATVFCEVVESNNKYRYRGSSQNGWHFMNGRRNSIYKCCLHPNSENLWMLAYVTKGSMVMGINKGSRVRDIIYIFFVSSV
jgi:hypothetical protein